MRPWALRGSLAASPGRCWPHGPPWPWRMRERRTRPKSSMISSSVGSCPSSSSGMIVAFSMMPLSIQVLSMNV